MEKESQEKIAILGGSNGLLKWSYVLDLKESNLNVSNFSVGATNSTFGLVNGIKHKVWENYDTLIFEYHVNDNLMFHEKVQTMDQIKKTLTLINNYCAKYKVKLIFVLIHTRHRCNKKMSKVYHSIAEKGDVLVIDMINEKKKECYSDQTHLNPSTMKVLSKRIQENISLAKVPKHIKGFNSLKLDSYSLNEFKDHVDTEHFETSIVSVDYFNLEKEIEIEFDKQTQILVIEYLSEWNSKAIEIQNTKNKIQKCLLVNYNLVKVKKRTILSLLTFCKPFNFQLSKKYKIRNISKNQIDESVLGKEYNKPHTDLDNNMGNAKIVSMLVTRGAKIINIKTQ